MANRRRRDPWWEAVRWLLAVEVIVFCLVGVGLWILGIWDLWWRAYEAGRP